jgi:hypothetical protein
MMADAKLTALAEDTDLTATDLLYVVANPGTTPASKKATIATVLTAAGTIPYTNITASGLITAGSVHTAGTIGSGAITSSGLLTAANITTAGTAYVGGALTAVGNITNTAGTIATTRVTASGLVSAGNIATAGTLGVTGNATVGGTLTLGTQVWTYGTNYPAAGTWYVGNLCFNTIPAAGSAVGWACVGAGTTGGTWLGFGTL